MDSCDSLLAAIDAFDGAALIVTHNEMFLHSLATRFIVFDRGEVRVFDGSYQDFLDRVGWEMDETLAGKPTATSVEAPAPAPRTAADKKMARQARARMVQDRSRAIGPLEDRVARAESSIMALERDKDNTFTALATASASGDAAAIAELSRRSREIEERIEAAFAELESATNALERATKSFEQRWKETS
jgi:ATP-binding cassette subfamily F protein 3